ncbi:hypothetical protein [Succinimonas sp.]|uniref:hypothetical protein n=1 Tax=Succinimonas sp. TaxID=1936151 RepID=UPI00386FF0B5
MNIYDDRTYEKLAKEGGPLPVEIDDHKGYQEVERRLSALRLPRSVSIKADSPVKVYYLFQVKPRPEALWEMAA